MAWKRSSVRSRPGPPTLTIFPDRLSRSTATCGKESEYRFFATCSSFLQSVSCYCLILGFIPAHSEGFQRASLCFHADVAVPLEHSAADVTAIAMIVKSDVRLSASRVMAQCRRS